MEGYSSEIESTNAGVPQGLVLEPFLFSICIIDIVENISNQIRLFADDTSLFVVVDDNDNDAAKSLTFDLEILHLQVLMTKTVLWVTFLFLISKLN